MSYVVVKLLSLNVFFTFAGKIYKMVYRKYIYMLFLLFSLFFSCSENENKKEMETRKNKIVGVKSYRREFNDLNPKHLSAAKNVGIRPISSRGDLPDKSRDLLPVCSNEFYSVDPLTHSIPYLVPKAGALLMSIAMNFQDSLVSKGMDKYKLIVTSVLRTKNDVKKLRRRNVNASMNSAHFYGTTFDISYNRFDKVLENGEDVEVRELKPKLVLSEVLKSLRDADMCYVKYEIKQGCFHITVR